MQEHFTASKLCLTPKERYQDFSNQLLEGLPAIKLIDNIGIDFNYIEVGDDLSAFSYHGGVHVGSYLAETQGTHQFPNAISLALQRNPGPIRLVLPMGQWNMTRHLTEVDGLRSNICFDGKNPNSCILTKANGQMFLITTPGFSNLTFKNITCKYTSPLPFTASINIESGNNLVLDNMHFETNLSGITGDGIRHGVFLLGGSNHVIRNCTFDGAQLQCCGLARSLRGCKVYNNRFYNCNDLGISANSGDGPGSGLSIKDVHIHDNEFFGVMGTGFIYVGDDAVTNPPDEMTDIVIEDNLCTGNIFTQLTPGNRTGIQAAWAKVNKRIKIRNNTVINNNTTVNANAVRGIYAFLRASTMTSASDVEISNNTVGFISASNMFEAIAVTGAGLTNFRINGNTVEPGSRGIILEDISESEVKHNRINNSIGNALTLGAVRGNISDIQICCNPMIRTTAEFKSSILFTGNNSATKLTVDNNRLVSNQNSIISTAGSQWNWKYTNNSHSHTLGSGATPNVNTGNTLE